MKKGFLLSLIATSILLVGCTEESLRDKLRELESQVETLKATNEQLQFDLINMQITEEKIETSLRTVEGSNVPQFVKIEDKIVYPNPLTLPSAYEDVNNSNIMVGSRFKFTPSDNWLMRMRGTTLELSHPLEIWGNIKSVGVSENIYNEEEMKNIVQRFFNGFPATNITYRNVYIDDRIYGKLARAVIEVEGEPYIVNVGFVNMGDYGLLMLFNYKDNETGVQQELIDLLLSSGRIGDMSLKLE